MIRWLYATAQMVLLASGLLITPNQGFSDEYYPARTVWDRFIGGQLNVSTFAFRDINRNGAYDMADHPMAGVLFEVAGGGRTITRRTNKSGFGNFPMSVQDREKDIVNRGEYTFLAMIPSGWLLTTDNASQRSIFDIMPGAPADMVSSIPPQPVGLAQELTITGRVSKSPEAALARPPALGDDSDRIRVRAISAEGKQQEVAVDQTGSFSFAVTPGDWTVVAENSVGDVLGNRQVEISVAPVLLATLLPNEAQREVKPRTLIGFDDLVTMGIKEIPIGYHDLNWHNWVATHHKFYNGEGYVNTTMSGEFVAYNSSGHPVKISRERPFHFVGGYFGSAWLRQAEGETLRVKGWRDDVLAYDESIKLSALGPIYFSANFRNVTRLEFATRHYWQFVCDDLEFDVPN